MKSLSKYLAILAAIAGLVTVTARAEDEKPAPKHERGGDKDRPERPKLTEEERAKVKAAREAAEKDPAVIKAKEAKDRKGAMEAFKAAMLKADPSLAPLLEKYPFLAAPMLGHGEHGKPGEGKGRPERGPKHGKPGEKPAEKPAAE